MKSPVLLSLPVASSLLANREDYEDRFYNWMRQHGHRFRDGDEFTKRLDIWADNDDYITEHNGNNHSYTLGHNQYSHLTSDEFREQFMGFARFNVPQVSRGIRSHAPVVNIDELAESIDWRDIGAVTPVKNQGACGSCWSFSATGALEGAYFNKYKKLVSFSEEELVDCDTVDMGCRGGLMDNAFDFIKKAGGLCSEEDYPYIGDGQERCQARQCEVVKGSAIRSWVDVKPTEISLMQALNKGPVSVAIEADQRGFQLYSSGIFTGRCGTNLDHGVLAVGYGAENGQSYWLVKNSWSEAWGDDGFIKIERGSPQQGGKCGILLSASYPLL